MIRFFSPRHEDVVLVAEIAAAAQTSEFTADEALLNLLDVTTVPCDLWAHPTTLKKWKAVQCAHAAWKDVAVAAEAMAKTDAAEDAKYPEPHAATVCVRGKPPVTVLENLWDDMMDSCRHLATYLDAYARVRLGDAPAPGPNTITELLAMVPERARDSSTVETVRAYIMDYNHTLAICQSQTHSTTAMYLLGMAAHAHGVKAMANLVSRPIHETPEGIYGEHTLKLYSKGLHTAKIQAAEARGERGG